MKENVVDFAQLRVLDNIVSVQDLQGVSKKAGLYFFFNREGVLLYIGSTSAPLRERVKLHMKGTANTKAFYNQILFVGWLEIQGDKHTLEALKLMLINAYFPLYNRHNIKRENQKEMITIHSRCLEIQENENEPEHVTRKGKTEKHQKSRTETEESFVTYASLKDKDKNKMNRDFWSMEEAVSKLNKDREELIIICNRLVEAGYILKKDMRQNVIFTMHDLAVIQVFTNMSKRHGRRKRSITDSINLVKKFGVKEALRISERV